MKKLYFLIVLLYTLIFSQNLNAQGLLDSVKFTPGNICHTDSFTISMWVWSPTQPATIDSITQLLRNDTLHLNGYLTGGMLGATIRVFTTLKVKTPPSGKYILYFQRYMNNGSMSPMLYGSHTDSFSVCMGSPLTVPENNSKNQLAIEVYPNPVSNILTIQLPETKSQTTTATLTDITGKKVLSQELNSEIEKLNIATLPAGIYMLQLQSENRFKIIKVIKQ